VDKPTEANSTLGNCRLPVVFTELALGAQFLPLHTKGRHPK
jgi:hypothetical protein